MTPDDALARWGRHDNFCSRNDGDFQPCTCLLDAEIARQAEWARLAELAVGLGWLCGSDQVDELVALARRLRAEGA